MIRTHGRATWERVSGYRLRNLVESTFHRLKRIFGPGLSSRLLKAQIAETYLRCAALNRMAMLGLPDGYVTWQ